MGQVYTKQEKSSRIKGIVGAASGNLVEWFDFYIYAVFAVYFTSGVYVQQAFLCVQLVVGCLDALQISMVEKSRWLSRFV